MGAQGQSRAAAAPGPGPEREDEAPVRAGDREAFGALVRLPPPELPPGLEEELVRRFEGRKRKG